jgi:hypothetical protein
MHFYFKRSALADTGGYYDCSGGAQVMTNVDFKSITSTGTGGISAQRHTKPPSQGTPRAPHWMSLALPPCRIVVPTVLTLFSRPLLEFS